MPADLIVSGAGSAHFNGTYIYQGTMNGEPYWDYEYSQHVTLRVFWDSGFSIWNMCEVGFEEMPYYWANAIDGIWTAMMGQEPAPTVAYSGGGVDHELVGTAEIVVAASGELSVSGQVQHDLAGDGVIRVAASGSLTVGGTMGIPWDAMQGTPTDIAMMPDGAVFVACRGPVALYRLTPTDNPAVLSSLGGRRLLQVGGMLQAVTSPAGAGTVAGAYMLDPAGWALVDSGANSLQVWRYAAGDWQAAATADVPGARATRPELYVLDGSVYVVCGLMLLRLAGSALVEVSRPWPAAHRERELFSERRAALYDGPLPRRSVRWRGRWWGMVQRLGLGYADGATVRQVARWPYGMQAAAVSGTERDLHCWRVFRDEDPVPGKPYPYSVIESASLPAPPPYSYEQRLQYMAELSRKEDALRNELAKDGYIENTDYTIDAGIDFETGRYWLHVYFLRPFVKCWWNLYDGGRVYEAALPGGVLIVTACGPWALGHDGQRYFPCRVAYADEAAIYTAKVSWGDGSATVAPTVSAAVVEWQTPATQYPAVSAAVVEWSDGSTTATPTVSAAEVEWSDGSETAAPTVSAAVVEWARMPGERPRIMQARLEWAGSDQPKDGEVILWVLSDDARPASALRVVTDAALEGQEQMRGLVRTDSEDLPVDNWGSYQAFEVGPNVALDRPGRTVRVGIIKPVGLTGPNVQIIFKREEEEG